MNTET